MILSNLRLINFRCYSNFSWEVPSKGAIIVGKNAEGKTSLLEAICFLIRLSSPRTSRSMHLIHQGTQRMGLLGQLGTQTRRIVWSSQEHDLQVNGHKRPDQRSYLQDSMPVVWFGNRDLEIVRSGNEHRRKYLDSLGTQWHPTYRETLVRYNKTLRIRNYLLKTRPDDFRQQQVYSSELVRYGLLLTQLREDLVSVLRPHIIQACHSVTQMREDLTIHYHPSIEGDYARQLEDTLADDLRTKQTQLGPHRDDLELEINRMKASEYLSEGQQRTIAIAMKMAQATLLREETGISPIHLIDDIFGELDLDRRQSLLLSLPADSQTFITTTHLTWVSRESLPYPVWSLSNHNLECFQA